jgi:hypothetical protein
MLVIKQNNGDNYTLRMKVVVWDVLRRFILPETALRSPLGRWLPELQPLSARHRQLDR